MFPADSPPPAFLDGWGLNLGDQRYSPPCRYLQESASTGGEQKEVKWTPKAYKCLWLALPLWHAVWHKLRRHLNAFCVIYVILQQQQESSELWRHLNILSSFESLSVTEQAWLYFIMDFLYDEDLPEKPQVLLFLECGDKTRTWPLTDKSKELILFE